MYDAAIIARTLNELASEGFEVVTSHFDTEKSKHVYTFKEKEK